MSRNSAAVDLNRHHRPSGLSDRIAFLFVRFLRFFADTFFAKRYGHRAVVLETVAAVPGMVGGMLNHLKSLRRMQDDRGWIKTLLDEAENERMHLMTFIAVAKPNWLERALVLLVQGVFFNCFFVLYLFAPRTAHRIVGYFEEEAVVSYTQYLAEIEAGRHENVAGAAHRHRLLGPGAGCAAAGGGDRGARRRSGPPRRQSQLRRSAIGRRRPIAGGGVDA